MNLYQNLNQSIQCDRRWIRTIKMLCNLFHTSTLCVSASHISLLIIMRYHSPPGHLPVFPSRHPLLRSQVFLLVGWAINCDAVAAETGFEPVTPGNEPSRCQLHTFSKPNRYRLFNHPCWCLNRSLYSDLKSSNLKRPISLQCIWMQVR